MRDPEVPGTIGFRNPLCCIRENQEGARVEIEEEAGEQGFVVEDMAGEIVAEPVTEPPVASP